MQLSERNSTEVVAVAEPAAQSTPWDDAAAAAQARAAGVSV